MLLIGNREATSPAVNLAIEEYTVRRLPAEEEYLLIYRNSSSVILGKHQNHIQEVNLRYCGENNVPIFRRISGGGAVYHDLGNLNFSIVTRKTMQNFNRYREFLNPVLKALNRLGLNAILDERNNIICDGYKLSGNAQFTSRERLLSHGTLLLNTDLDKLRGSLSQDKNKEIQSRATKSITAKVANAGNLPGKEIEFDDMKNSILNEIGDVEIIEFNDQQWLEIQKLAGKKFYQHSWNLELSPSCRVRKWDDYYMGETEVEKGIIKSMVVQEKDQAKGKSWDMTPFFGGCLYEYHTLLDKSQKSVKTQLPFNPIDYLI